MSDHNRRRVEVFCLTYGEPEENEFFPQFYYSVAILNRLTRRVAPIPKFATFLLAARRARIRKNDFEEKGYHSPLEPITEEQARRIEEILRRKRPGVDFRARMVREFRKPYIPEVLEKLRNDPPDDMVMLPLYVAESDFTTGVSRTDLARFHREKNGEHNLPGPAYVGGFGFDERIGKVMADFVWRFCQESGWDEEKCRDSALILGAHGTLQYPPEGINSGARETLYLYGQIRRHLKDRFRTVRIGWLNHTIGGKWTFPAADESASEVWEKGIRKVVYFPFGFFGDNNESQNEGKDALAEFAWDDLLYLPCVNADEEFCEVMADMILERLDDPYREEWEEIEHGGRRDLIQRPRPAIAGRPGPLNFQAPVLASFAIGFWFLAAGMLFYRGWHKSVDIESSFAMGLTVFSALIIGWLKGTCILGPVVSKNLRRIRRLPQPAFLFRFFSKLTWIFIFCMITLGIALRFAGISAPVYTAILWGVGLGLAIGGLVGARNFRQAMPREIVTMSGLHPIKAWKARRMRAS